MVQNGRPRGVDLEPNGQTVEPLERRGQPQVERWRSRVESAESRDPRRKDGDGRSTRDERGARPRLDGGTRCLLEPAGMRSERLAKQLKHSYLYRTSSHTSPVGS